MRCQAVAGTALLLLCVTLVGCSDDSPKPTLMDASQIAQLAETLGASFPEDVRVYFRKMELWDGSIVREWVLHSDNKIEIPAATWSPSSPEDSVDVIRTSLPAGFEIGKPDVKSAELGDLDTAELSFIFVRLRTAKGWFVRFAETEIH